MPNCMDIMSQIWLMIWKFYVNNIYNSSKQQPPLKVCRRQQQTMPFCDWSVHFGDGVSDSEGEALLDSLFGPN